MFVALSDSTWHQGANVQKHGQKPTIGSAFKAWLVYSQAALSPEEYTSAKNFVRAYQIWLGKCAYAR